MALRISDMSDDFIRRIVEEYLRFMATMETVGEKYKMTATTVSNILYKAVSENIVDDITAQAIVAKAKSYTKNVVRTQRRWDEALELRKNPAKQRLQNYQMQLNAAEASIKELKENLAQTEFQLETYDDYFFNDPDAPSKKTLRCTICHLKNKIASHENDVKECKENIEKLIKKG